MLTETSTTHDLLLKETVANHELLQETSTAYELLPETALTHELLPKEPVATPEATPCVEVSEVAAEPLVQLLVDATVWSLVVDPLIVPPLVSSGTVALPGDIRSRCEFPNEATLLIEKFNKFESHCEAPSDAALSICS